MHAMIHMQPLDARRQPCAPVQFVGTVPRDAQPHRVGAAWNTEHLKEQPYFVRVWADRRHGGDFEVECVGPSKLRKLNSVTFYQHLTVLPRRQ